MSTRNSRCFAHQAKSLATKSVSWSHADQRSQALASMSNASLAVAAAIIGDADIAQKHINEAEGLARRADSWSQTSSEVQGLLAAAYSMLAVACAELEQPRRLR